MIDKDKSSNGISSTEAPVSPSWKVWLKTSRLFSLSATISPMLVGTAIAAYEGTFHLAPFLVALFSALFLQIGANYFNEYFDYRYGLDSLASLGSSTVIFRKEMTAAQVLGGGISSFVIAAGLGVLLIYEVGPAIILFGLVGMAIAYFYSARPFTLASRGLAGLLPLFSLLVWITFPLAFSNVRAVLAANERKVFMIGIKRTSLLHLQFGVVLALGLVIAMRLQ